jgi:hypothetical protein
MPADVFTMMATTGDLEDHEDLGEHPDAKPDDDERHEGDDGNRGERRHPGVHDLVEPAVHPIR